MPSLSPELLRDYDRLRIDQGCFALPDLSLIELLGEDRVEWLQGQTTNDLRGKDLGGAISACLCSATGQTLATMDIWQQPSRILLSIPTVCVAAFMSRVDQMVIMEDVSATVSPLTATTVQGPNALKPTNGEIILASSRVGLSGWDVWGASNLPTNIDPAVVEIIRIEAGEPRFGTDLSTKTLPPEMGPAFVAKYVSYTKGCYTGQEILMRIHSRGHTNRTWTGLRTEERVEAGASVICDGKEIGLITSSVLSPRLGPIATALLRNDHIGNVTVNGIPAERQTLPFRMVG